MFISSCSNDELEPKGKCEIANDQNLIGKWVDDGSNYVDTYFFLMADEVIDNLPINSKI